ncbi:MAG: 4-hydroxy-3-methylbut-2-enyl diphosphate reductase [Verrucomicrobiota bacterium]
MAQAPDKHVVIACPHGFCAGVVRAIASAKKALAIYKRPIYCLNEIVHNERVVSELNAEGMIFVKDIAKVPPGAMVLFSAHGIPPGVRRTAEKAGLRVIDATCPFVEKIHQEVRYYAAKEYTVFVIGHSGHEEIIGIAGEAPGNVKVLSTPDEAERIEPIWDNGKTAVVTQTTFSISATQKIINTLKRRFPRLETQKHKDICYATENRQKATAELCKRVDLVLVLGSKNSSNTRRLFEIAAQYHPDSSYMVSNLGDMKSVGLERHSAIGITAGASTPESFMEQVLGQLKSAGFERTDVLKVAMENVNLLLPAAIR